MKYYYIYKKKQMRDLMKDAKVNANTDENTFYPLISGAIREEELEEAKEIASTYEGVGIKELSKEVFDGKRFKINVHVHIEDHIEDREEDEKQYIPNLGEHYLSNISSTIKLTPQKKLKKEEEPEYFFIKAFNIVEADLDYQVYPDELYIEPKVLNYFPVYRREGSLLYSFTKEVVYRHSWSVELPAGERADRYSRQQYEVFNSYQNAYFTLRESFSSINYNNIYIIQRLGIVLIVSPVTSIKDFENQLLIEASRI